MGVSLLWENTTHFQRFRLPMRLLADVEELDVANFARVLRIADRLISGLILLSHKVVTLPRLKLPGPKLLRGIVIHRI